MLSVLSNFIFGNSNLFGSKQSSSNSSWKDKRLAFDLRPSSLRLEDGEQLIARFFPVEDVKGNPDEIGVLEVTNLRLIWICCAKTRVNLSIGWRSVSLTFVQNLKNSLGSPISSLVVLTKYGSTKYEFVFNKMSLYNDLLLSGDLSSDFVRGRRLFGPNGIPRRVNLTTPINMIDSFDVVFKVWQAYKRTQLFRCSRANLTSLLPSSDSSSNPQAAYGKVSEYNKLPSEETIDIYPGIEQSESRSMKYFGSLIITNIRLIWIDDSLPLRNLSIPYIQIESMKVKQGDRLLINTFDYLATTNQVELSWSKKNANSKRAKSMFEQLQNLCTLYKSKPRFGPESCDECIQIASWLTPISDFQSSDELREILLKSEEGAPDAMNFLIDNVILVQTNEGDENEARNGSENSIEALEEQEKEFLRVSSTKVDSYATDGRGANRAESIIYSPGKS